MFLQQNILQAMAFFVKWQVKKKKVCVYIYIYIYTTDGELVNNTAFSQAIFQIISAMK